MQEAPAGSPSPAFPMKEGILHHPFVPDLELIDEGKLRFEQLYDQENKVTVGERIVTSNISEKFVEGLFIGYVSEVQVDSNNLTKTGTIVTPVDFLHLKDVFVRGNSCHRKCIWQRQLQ